MQKRTISNSQLDTYLGCGWKYKLKYVDKRFYPPTPQMVLGGVVHRVIELSMIDRKVGQEHTADEMIREGLLELQSRIDSGIRMPPDIKTAEDREQIYNELDRDVRRIIQYYHKSAYPA